MNIRIPTFKKRGVDQEAVKKEVSKQLITLIQEGSLECAGYTSLDQDPTILTACQAIAGKK